MKMKEEIINWLNRIEQIDGIPPIEVIAFNIGIYESENGFELYLVGGYEYDEDDDDWACIEMPEAIHRYMSLPPELSKLKWEDLLKNIANTLKELEKEGRFKTTILKNAQAITTGFDDGELIKIR